jgi:O-antigen ligase
MFPSVIISIILGIALWLSGTSEHAAQVLVLVSLGCAVALSLVVREFRPQWLPQVWDWRWGAPLLALTGLIAIQAVNASHTFLPVSRTLLPQHHQAWLPRSVDGAATFWAWFLFLGYAAAFWLGRVWLTSSRARLTFVILQVAMGSAMAWLVISQRSQPPPGALYPETGTFVSPNHYAAYANVVLALALFWGLDLSVKAWRRRRVVHAGWLLFPASGLIFVSVIRCGSRMGAAVAILVVLALVTGIALKMVLNRPRLALVAGAVAGSILLGLVIVKGSLLKSLFMPEKPVGQLVANVAPRLSEGQIRGSVVSRWGVNRALVGMVADRWTSGVGAGTFALAFPYYQPSSLPGFYRHAHNEYLQCLAELGTLGLALLVWMACAILFARPPGCSGSQGLSLWESWGIILALCSLGLHALTDFPLRLPALSLLVAFLVGMSGGQAGIFRIQKEK